MAGGDGSLSEIRVTYVVPDSDRGETLATEVESCTDSLSVAVETDPERIVEAESYGETDCVVTAYALDGYDGVGVCERIKESAEIPCILYAQVETPDRPDRVLESAADGYVPAAEAGHGYVSLAQQIRTVVGTDKRRVRDRFASLVEFSSTVIAVVDEQGTIEYISPSVKRVMGYTPEEMRDGTAFEYIHPEDREHVWTKFQEMVTSTERVVTSVEFRAKHKDGSWVWIEAIGTNETDTAIEGYVINYRDITRRKEYERELERVNQQYEAILNDPETFVGVLDTEWRLLEVNDTALEFVDASRESVIRERFPETPWWEGASVSTETVESHLERATAGEIVRFDVEVVGASGDRRFLDVVFYPVTDGDTVESLMAIGRNITDLKRRERALDALHEATRKFAEAQDRETVLEHAVEAVEAFLDEPLAGAWLYDEKQEALRPVARTEFAARTIGGQPTFTGSGSLIWDAFQAGEYRLYDDVTAEPGRYREDPMVQSEIVLPLNDVGVLTIGAPQQETFEELDFALARLLAANTEAALHRATREATLREQRSQLEQQNEQLEQVASILSHDLRNPLNVATLRTELAQRETDSPHLEDVVTALDRMEQLIEDVLRLARGGQSVTDTEPVPIDDIVSECWTVVKTGDATVKLEERFTIEGDATKLRHVFENLFGNCVEHGAVPGSSRSDNGRGSPPESVTVRVGRLEDGFYIADDGPGIPEDDRDRIFEAGFSSSEGGTGFGLTIVETIATAHGWELSVTESAEGGARFEFRNVDFVNG